jgi:hypothetical protein
VASSFIGFLSRFYRIFAFLAGFWRLDDLPQVLNMDVFTKQQIEVQAASLPLRLMLQWRTVDVAVTLLLDRVQFSWNNAQLML